VSLHPLLRRAATPAVPENLRWDEPLKLHQAATAWAIAVGQVAKDAAEMIAVRNAAHELAAAAEPALLAAADEMALAAPGSDSIRALVSAVDGELFRLLAAHGDVPGGVPKPTRERGPSVVGPPLSDNFRRCFGTWLSWDVFDPFSKPQLAWGAAACAADLARRLDDAGRLEEAERIETLVKRWDNVSLLALERCSCGSWLESDLTESALAGVLEEIARRLREPPEPPAAAGQRPRTEALPTGAVDWPVGMATRFDSPNVQLQAKRRAERLVEAERPPPTLFVDGKLYPNMVSYVVSSTQSEGFGNGAVVERDSFGRPKPGRPVGHVFQLRQARVIFANEGSATRWGIVTYFPTDEQALG